MKLVTTAMLLLLSFSTPAMSLSYKDHVNLKKIEIVKDLPVNLFKLYRGLPFVDVRMIAGKFDTSRNFGAKKKFYERCSR